MVQKPGAAPGAAAALAVAFAHIIVLDPRSSS